MATKYASKSDIAVLIGKIKTALTTKTDKTTTQQIQTKLDTVEQGANKYVLPTASSSTLGGIKVGNNLTISDGVLSGTPDTKYVLPTASTSVLGGIKVGNNLTISNGVLSGTPDTKYENATGTKAGLMSTTDKIKLDNSWTSTQAQQAINEAVGSVVGVSFEIVTNLPTTGTPGTIYLIAHSHSDNQDIYDEYVWIAAQKKFEKIGNTDVDLSGYLLKTDIGEIGTTEMASLWDTTTGA